MWVTMFQLAVVAVYGYPILLSLWAMRVQLAASRAFHHPHDHSPTRHIVERATHGYIATVLMVSLAVRMAQLNTDLTPWLLVPLTIVVALWTARWLISVQEMANEDLDLSYIGRLNRLKTNVLFLCTIVLLIDQVWRVLTLFWF
jgi:hypothetical protein